MAVKSTQAATGQFIALWLVVWLLLWLVVCMAAYALNALVVEPLERWWQKRAAAQKRAKDVEAAKREMARIDANAAEAVERMGQAYLQAQALIRQEVRRQGRP